MLFSDPTARSPCCAEVAARALGAAVDRAIVIVVAEVPVGRVDGLVASPAVQCLAGVEATLVGGACALVGGVGVAVGSWAARLVPRSLVLVAPAALPFADARAVEAGPLHCGPISRRVIQRVTYLLSR